MLTETCTFLMSGKFLVCENANEDRFDRKTDLNLSCGCARLMRKISSEFCSTERFPLCEKWDTYCEKMTQTCIYLSVTFSRLCTAFIILLLVLLLCTITCHSTPTFTNYLILYRLELLYYYISYLRRTYIEFHFLTQALFWNLCNVQKKILPLLISSVAALLCTLSEDRPF